MPFRFRERIRFARLSKEGKLKRLREFLKLTRFTSFPIPPAYCVIQSEAIAGLFSHVAVFELSMLL